ncbi:peptidoglycan-associated lipoprotein Pal [Deltaproteobacteria bacterium OttesenSCG-928-K17]|nr:peptidoglycan-associated lipoprotein Pal [Deltaproteobacteria bacterium OttesenSCG-928-K17]
MKKLLMVVLAGLVIMPLAAGCSCKTKQTYGGSEYDAQKAAFLGDHVYFDFDRYNIRPDGAAVIQAKAAFMSQYSGVRAEIQGHCDERGTEVYNMALGDRRARATYNYITSLGVDGSRLSTVSYGKERPVDPGHNESAWARNRRAQFVITAE